MPETLLTAVVPRRLDVHRPDITIDGHTLSDVALGGWAYGPELGTAPVVVIVGGITASPFPFGDGQGDAQGGIEAWWPALFSADLIDPARMTVLCPCWPGNGSTWRGFDDARDAAGDLGARASPIWWRRGSTAAAARRR